MMLVDSDVLLIDLRYVNDPKFAINRQSLQQFRADNVPLGITSQALLETVGKLSFNTSPGRDSITQMCQQMALGDAVQAVQIARFASSAKCLLTWNARHFQGKLVIPALTPQDWLNQRAAATL